MCGEDVHMEVKRATPIEPPLHPSENSPELYSQDELIRSRKWCRTTARRTARNFYYSFLTLSGEKFQGMCALYAFLRVTDDLGDDPSIPAADRETRLQTWNQELRRFTTHRLENHPVWPALHQAQQLFSIPLEQLEAVVHGVQMDLHPVAIQSFEELSRYCYHVAGAVGFCCLRIWGTSHPEADRLAIDCGLAFQLTNILRDLREDAELGRIYLPREDLDRFHYTELDLRTFRRNDAFRNLMAFQVERARNYYLSAEKLQEYLPADARPVFRTMLRIYREILEEIPRREFDVYSRRVRLSPWRKSWIVSSEWLRSHWQS